MTRCLLADDHPALAVALCAFLAGEGYALVGPAADGRAAVELAATERPELALVDYRMPRLSGADLVRTLADASPSTRIAVYTADADASLVADALAAGATAVVLKNAPLPDLGRALAAALEGRAYVDPGVPPTGLREPATSLHPVTARELQVLRLLADGLSHEAIAERLAIGSETVRTHARKASDRLGASTRTQAVAAAMRLGLID